MHIDNPTTANRRSPRERQMIDGTVEARTDLQLDLQAMEWRKQIETLTEDLNHPQRNPQRA